MTELDPAEVSGGRIRIARSRGAVSGILLILLGAWGALAPLVGPYWNFGFTPNETWNMTDGRWWFQVLPGIVTVIGGLLLFFGTDRITTSIGGWIAAAAGAWYVIGVPLQPNLTLGSIGEPIHSSLRASTIERLALFEGLGVLIVFVSAYALGRLAVVGVRDVRHARHRAAKKQELEATAVPAIDVRQRRADDGHRRGLPAGGRPQRRQPQRHGGPPADPRARDDRHDRGHHAPGDQGPLGPHERRDLRDVSVYRRKTTHLSRSPDFGAEASAGGHRPPTLRLRLVITCPECGAENAEGARFCSSCGTALALACRTCGQQLQPSDVFCSHCGTRVNPATADRAHRPRSRSTPRWQRTARNASSSPSCSPTSPGRRAWPTGSTRSGCAT